MGLSPAELLPMTRLEYLARCSCFLCLIPLGVMFWIPLFVYAWGWWTR